jgi:hypothetical protein
MNRKKAVLYRKDAKNAKLREEEPNSRNRQVDSVNHPMGEYERSLAFLFLCDLRAFAPSR